MRRASEGVGPAPASGARRRATGRHRVSARRRAGSRAAAGAAARASTPARAASAADGARRAALIGVTAAACGPRLGSRVERFTNSGVAAIFGMPVCWCAGGVGRRVIRVVVAPRRGLHERRRDRPGRLRQGRIGDDVDLGLLAVAAGFARPCTVGSRAPLAAEAARAANCWRCSGGSA